MKVLREPEICAGPPCGVSADLLANVITANLALGSTTIADLMVPAPVDHTELQTLCWATRIAVCVEQQMAQRLTYGVLGAWVNHRSPRIVHAWIRQMFQTIVGRPN